MEFKTIMLISDDVKTIFRDSEGKNRDPDKYSKELGLAHCELWQQGQTGSFQME